MAEQSKTVDAALRLLSILGAGHEAARGDETAAGPATASGTDSSAASFARRLRLSRTAVGRILTTLEAHGLARRTERGWDLGLGVLSLAGRIEPVLRAAARPALEALADRFGETAVLALRDGAEVVAVDQVVATRRLVQVRYRPGTRHELGRAAHGRALLPGQAAGYVVSEDELEAGVTAVAAPILAGTAGPSGGTGAGGDPVASIGVVAPSERFPPRPDVVEAVQAAARSVTAELARTPEGGAARRPGPGPTPGTPAEPGSPTGPGPGSPTEPGGDDAVLPASR